jgi:hypothetical protein
LAAANGIMLQTVSSRPKMERQSPCNHYGITFRMGRSSQPRHSSLDACQSLLANPTHARFCEEMKKRQ